MRKTAAVLLLLTLTALCGCASAVKRTPVYLYAVGIGADEENVYLSALCCEGTSQGNTGEDGSGEGTGRNDGRPLERYHYGGKTVKEAFGRMQKECRELYVGTLCVYVTEPTLSKTHLTALGTYLLNAPSLPVNVGLCEADDADALLESFEAAYTDKEIAEALDGRYENVITALAKRCGHEA